MQIITGFMKGIKSTNMLQLYTANFNLFKMVVQYQFFPTLMVQMLFFQIQQAPGPSFIMVGQSLDSLRGPLFGVWNQVMPKLTSI